MDEQVIENTEEQIDQDSNRMVKLLKTKDVAEMLNEPEQTIRNMCNKFDFYLSPIKKTRGGQRLFSNKNILELEHIQSLLRNGYTYSQIKESLSNPAELAEHIVPGSSQTEIVEKLTQLVAPQVIESLKDDLSAIIDNSIKKQFEEVRKMFDDNITLEKEKALLQAEYDLLEKNYNALLNERELEENQYNEEKEDLYKKLEKEFEENNELLEVVRNNTEEMRLLREEKFKKRSIFSLFSK